MKVTEKIKMLVMGLAAVSTLGAAVAFAPVAGAISNAGSTAATKWVNSSYQAEATGNGTDLMTILNIIINVALGIIGFVAVAMIILGGVQYATSAGDAAKVTKAKNTILYGVVGLIIALLAFAIVNFILSNIFGNQG